MRKFLKYYPYVLCACVWSVGAGTAWTQVWQLNPLVQFNGTNGANPNTALIPGNNGIYYGTTYNRGSNNLGTVFNVTTNGTLTTLVNFARTNGANPKGLTWGADGNLYGTTYYGGDSSKGTVFALTTNGALTTLVSFNTTNGANPNAALTPGTDGSFYGTTVFGGDNKVGTVFHVTTNGTLTTLVSFANTNGAFPNAALTPGTDGIFYGTTSQGGSNNLGTVFTVTTNGTLTTLASFNGANGAFPNATLTLGPDGSFYGTTFQGGSNNLDLGTVFKMTTNGTLTTLVSFNTTNGANPDADLTLGADGSFYGTTFGSSNGLGMLFQLSPVSVPPVPLDISPLSNTVVLSWTNPAFSLQSAPEVFGSYTNIPGSASPYTNPISGARQFFRLIEN